MKQYFQKLFAKPSIQELVAVELDEAERKLLEAQTGKEYADAMIKYQSDRIARLRAKMENRARVS